MQIRKIITMKLVNQPNKSNQMLWMTLTLYIKKNFGKIIQIPKENVKK